MNKLIFALLFGFFWAASVGAANSAWPLEKAPINLKDKSSLQRGAKTFVNYCQGCHGLQYIRYSRIAKDIGIVDAKGKILETLLKENLMFNTNKLGDTLQTAMNKEDASHWFGMVPPDLSLTARERGSDWIYTYLRSFYRDETKPWGVNNALFKDVAMPHVLADLQGVNQPIFHTLKTKGNGSEISTQVLTKLELVEPGTLSPEAYDKMVADLVNFLSYVGEPNRLERQSLGVWVILFLIVFLGVAYATKKEFWKDVH